MPSCGRLALTMMAWSPPLMGTDDICALLALQILMKRQWIPLMLSWTRWRCVSCRNANTANQGRPLRRAFVCTSMIPTSHCQSGQSALANLDMCKHAELTFVVPQAVHAAEFLHMAGRFTHRVHASTVTPCILCEASLRCRQAFLWFCRMVAVAGDSLAVVTLHPCSCMQGRDAKELC